MQTNTTMDDPLAHAEVLYLEHPEHHGFIEIREADNRMRVRKGTAGRPCLRFDLSWVTPNASRTQFDRLHQQFNERGFVALPPSAPIVEGSCAGQLWTHQILDHPLYSRFYFLPGADDLRDQRRRLFHFAQGLTVGENFDLEEIAELGLASGLIIEGDVRITGVFSQLTYTYPGWTMITGNVYAQSLGHADGHMSILGDLVVENIVYGHYNDGSLSISGTVSGRLWYSYDHDMSAQTYHIHCIEWGDEIDALVDELQHALKAEDDSFDRLIRDYMFEGRNPLRIG